MRRPPRPSAGAREARVYRLCHLVRMEPLCERTAAERFRLRLSILFWFRCLSRMIPHVAYSRLPCTICAAIESISRFDAVTDNLATAMGAARSERVNRTFKTVEHMRAAAHTHLEALVVLVSAHFTLSHFCSPPPKSFTETFSKNRATFSRCRLKTHSYNMPGDTDRPGAA